MGGIGAIAEKRAQQNRLWLWSELKNQLIWRVERDPEVARTAKDQETDLVSGRTTPRKAARELLSVFLR